MQISLLLLEKFVQLLSFFRSIYGSVCTKRYFKIIYAVRQCDRFSFNLWILLILNNLCYFMRIWSRVCMAGIVSNVFNASFITFPLWLSYVHSLNSRCSRMFIQPTDIVPCVVRRCAQHWIRERYFLSDWIRLKCAILHDVLYELMGRDSKCTSVLVDVSLLLTALRWRVFVEIIKHARSNGILLTRALEQPPSRGNRFECLCNFFFGSHMMNYVLIKSQRK